MKRLTMRNDRGMAFWRDLQSAGGGYRMTEDKKDQDRLDRLASYEDAMPIERAQELAQVEKDGRLVVLPCKKGDTLWSYYDYPHKGISKIVVAAVSTINGITVMSTDNYGEIPERDIGDTVFRTREEAEAELKKREEADNEAD